MDNDKPAVHNTNTGIGFCGLLTIVFIILKLCKVITWSWWWVLSPLWISWVMLFIIGILVGLVYLCIKD